MKLQGIYHLLLLHFFYLCFSGEGRFIRHFLISFSEEVDGLIDRFLYIGRLFYT